MREKRSLVDVIIVNYNAGKMLRKAVDCLCQQTFTNFNAVIVDNNSTDNSLDLLPELDARCKIIRLPDNTGFAKGNNIGASAGTAKWIVCLNPDAYAAPDWLEKLVERASAHPDIVMAGSTQITTLDHSVLDGAGDLYAPVGFAWRGLYHRPISLLPPTGRVFGPCAAAAMYRRDAFEEVGGFDEDFFCYHEDVDLAFRLRLMGGIAVQVREAVVHHVGSAITGTESPFAVYHGTRNRTWTFFKNMPLLPMILFAPAHIGLSALFLVRAIFKGRLKPTWMGVRDSITGLPAVWAKRRVVQRSTRVTTFTILRAMTWSPVRFFTRDADVRLPRR